METFKNLFENEDELFRYCCFAGSLIKYGNDLNKAWEKTFEVEDLLMQHPRVAEWTVDRIVSFAAGKKAEVVDGEPSSKGLEIRKYGEHWGMFKDGECIYSRKLLTGKCLKVLRIC